MSIMKPYFDVVSEVFRYGRTQNNKRTGAQCRVLTGQQMKFDLSKGFPALTSRKLPIKNTIAEMLGFFRGYTSAKDFRELGCSFWNANANETKAWLNNPIRKGEDDVGEIYGALWNQWDTYKFIKKDELTDSKKEYLVSKGWVIISSNYIDSISVGQPGIYYIFLNRINQLEAAVEKIMTDPSDRRIIVTGWNPGLIDFQSLPSCHMTYTFTPFEEEGIMDVTMHQRSADLFLGVPANIINTSIFLEVMCRLTGYKPGTVTIQMGNAHLYNNSYEAALTLLNRKEGSPPKLFISDKVKELKSTAEIPGCLARINPEDIYLTDYYPDEAIKVEMMA